MNVEKLVWAANEFVRKVEAGEAHSVVSYSHFKVALEAPPDGTLEQRVAEAEALLERWVDRMRGQPRAVDPGTHWHRIDTRPSDDFQALCNESLAFLAGSGAGKAGSGPMGASEVRSADPLPPAAPESVGAPPTDEELAAALFGAWRGVGDAPWSAYSDIRWLDVAAAARRLLAPNMPPTPPTDEEERT